VERKKRGRREWKGSGEGGVSGKEDEREEGVEREECVEERQEVGGGRGMMSNTAVVASVVWLMRT